MCYCGLPVKAKGLCSKHYLADYRERKEAGLIVKTSMGAILIAETMIRSADDKTCGVPLCNERLKAKNLCAKHYLRLNRALNKVRNDR